MFRRNDIHLFSSHDHLEEFLFLLSFEDLLGLEDLLGWELMLVDVTIFFSDLDL